MHAGYRPPEPAQIPELEDKAADFCAKLRSMAEKPNTLLALYRVFRWVVLIVLVFVIFAALRKPAPVASQTAPEAIQARSQDFDSKLQQLQEAHERGESSEARFTAEEVNAAITKSLEEPQSPAPVVQTTSSQPAPEAPTPGTPGGAPIRTAQIAFQGSEVTGQFATEMYGKEMYITISGYLGSRDGYVTFQPTGFKFGDLSIPVSLVNDALQKKLAEPENREKLHLPEFVSSLRVENGELVITQK